jgi:hypothetical protein
MSGWSCMLIVALLGFSLMGGPLLVGAASIRNIYFSSGQTVPGQRYSREEQLPGPTTTFTKGENKVARLFIIFGDVDAHSVRGELKASDGSVVRRFEQKIQPFNHVAQWRSVTHAFALDALKPGEYALDLQIDGEPKGTHKFTLRAP